MLINQCDGSIQMTVQSGNFFCFGFGYVASRLAMKIIGNGGKVIGTTRSSQKANKINSLSEYSRGIVWKSTDRIGDLPTGSNIVISVPPRDDGCPVYAAIGETAARARARSITYLSTTGVFGDRKGDWVTEHTKISPNTERSKKRALAEQQWLSLGGNIVRLPGIYGPGRSAFDRLRAGTAKRIVKPGHLFSRCHVDDIVSGLLGVVNKKAQKTSIFHLCDNEPAPPQDVIVHAAKMLGVEPPPEQHFETAELSEMARSFYSECKRVSNSITKNALAWQPQYPSYREGLEAILQEEAKP